PISTQQEKAAHSGDSSVRGYIVYAPQVVFSVGEADVCTQPLQNGKCPDGATRRLCVVGNPIVLPDFSKPFAVDIQSGLGKAGADVQIADGWRLTGVKDTSDNTALLTLLQKAAGLPLASTDKGCGEVAGLYRWKTDATPEATPSLERVFPANPAK
ncbi:MAG TPA: hypothetical protein VKE95_08750, partial [Burkholderiales bacterium]|nr:hypothetical protein [Burkholderiales bacterium]